MRLQVWCWLLLVWWLAGVALAEEPVVSYRLVQRDGRTVIQASTGETIPWLGYGNQIDSSMENWFKMYPDLTQAGIHLYHVNLTSTKQEGGHPFMLPDGSVPAAPHDTDFPAMIEKLIAHDPQAKFVIRFGMDTDLAWRKAHLDEFQALPPGALNNKDGHSVIPSLASEVALKNTEAMIRGFIGWCERQSWHNRVVVYLLPPYGEGTLELSFANAYFDNCAVMQRAFKAYIQQKYATDAALQQAWGDPRARLETVAVPTREEWLARKEQLKLAHWPDPAKVQRERDYFLLQQELFHRWWSRVLTAMQQATAERPVIKGYDICKQHQQGWMINANFGADWTPGTLDTFNSLLLASGSLGIGPLLDHPGLDVLITPGMYFTRAMGYAWESEGLSDTLALRGKSNYCEGDLRTWSRKWWGGKQMPDNIQIKDAGYFQTPEEMCAGFDRTLAWALTRNQMYYFTSVCGANYWYHQPPILEKINQEVGVLQKVPRLPWRQNTDAICLVIDDESPLYEDFSSGYQYLAVFRQIEEGLALCGVPYRTHLLSDLARKDFPEYKCYLFPNLFKVDARVEALLREKVLRNGHVAIFGPATGITDGKTLSADAASRLFGVPMTLEPVTTTRRVMLQHHGHPITAGLPALTFTDSYAYGPLLVPKEQVLPPGTGITSLGAGFYYYFFDRPGMFVRDAGRGGAGRGGKEAGDYAVVFTPAVPLPPELLRACARYAGCHIWTDRNAVIYAGDNTVALHAATAGPYTLHLPRRTPVWDLLTGKRLSSGTKTLTLTDTPPFTRLLFLGDLPKN
ncbi:MAG: hypothetical protein ACYDBB_12855 [Armatimonadota bacterium]